MTYFAHRGLAYFVLIKNPGSDITEVVEEHFGKTAGKTYYPYFIFCDFPYSVDLR